MAKKYFPPASLKPGYFLGQEAFSVPKNAMFRRLDPYFETFLTEDGAVRFFEQIAGKVDGLDYVNYWHEPADAGMGRRIAEIGRTHGVDMWAGIRCQKQFRDMPVVPGDFVAWTMEESGRISPALWEQRNHVIDTLNPRAVDWLLDVLEDRYWPHVKVSVNGLFFRSAASRPGLCPTAGAVSDPGRFTRILRLFSRNGRPTAPNGMSGGKGSRSIGFRSPSPR